MSRNTISRLSCLKIRVHIDEGINTLETQKQLLLLLTLNKNLLETSPQISSPIATHEFCFVSELPTSKTASTMSSSNSSQSSSRSPSPVRSNRSRRLSSTKSDLIKFEVECLKFALKETVGKKSTQANLLQSFHFQISR
jgi:hypothetical protein